MDNVTRLLLAIILALGLLLAIAAPARADVAMLPLDADARLEIYGQPVANKIARALQTGGVEVVVVKAGMDVPPSAQLVIRGKITGGGKGTPISISLEVSNPVDGTVLDRLNTSSPGLNEIDKAATDLAFRVLPVVRGRLDELAKRPTQPPIPPTPPEPHGAPRPAPQVLIGIAVNTSVGSGGAELRGALKRDVDALTQRAHRQPRDVDASTLHPKLAATTVSSAKADGAIAFEVLDYTVATHREHRAGKTLQVPLARARVRVRVADASRVMFDRVVATDTVVGDREMPVDALAARVAAEVLAILRPHLRRMVTSWP